MISLSRRGFLTSAAVASTLLAADGVRAGTPPLLLHDPALPAGRRFAARIEMLGGEAVALEGDRVRQIQAALAHAPVALFAVTQRSDELLVGEIAAEHGYRRIALVRHVRDGRMTARCMAEGKTIGALAHFAGTGWPEAFADMALDKIGQCPAVSDGNIEPAFSWVMIRA